MKNTNAPEVYAAMSFGAADLARNARDQVKSPEKLFDHFPSSTPGWPLPLRIGDQFAIGQIRLRIDIPIKRAAFKALLKGDGLAHAVTTRLPTDFWQYRLRVPATSTPSPMLTESDTILFHRGVMENCYANLHAGAIVFITVPPSHAINSQLSAGIEAAFTPMSMEPWNCWDENPVYAPETRIPAFIKTAGTGQEADPKSYPYAVHPSIRATRSFQNDPATAVAGDAFLGDGHLIIDPFADGEALINAHRQDLAYRAIMSDPREAAYVLKELEMVMGTAAIEANSGQTFGDFWAERTAKLKKDYPHLVLT